MRTAVIYSGQARSFEQCFANHRWHLFRKLDDFEIFASIERSPQADRMRELLMERYGDRVHFEAIDQPELPEPVPAPPLVAMYPPSSPPQAILRQFWALDQAWQLFQDCAHGKFDRVVRIRPDIAFASLEIPEPRSCWECHTPWWATWGGLNDRFAVLGSEAAYLYFTTFTKIPKFLDMGCPLHPETLLKAQMEGFNLTPLSALFVTVRMDGTMVQPSISMDEFAEYTRHSV